MNYELQGKGQVCVDNHQNELQFDAWLESENPVTRSLVLFTQLYEKGVVHSVVVTERIDEEIPE